MEEFLIFSTIHELNKKLTHDCWEMSAIGNIYGNNILPLHTNPSSWQNQHYAFLRTNVKTRKFLA